MIARRLLVATLIVLAVAATIALWISNAEARRRPRLEYAIVECPSWPWSGEKAINADLRQLATAVRGKRLHVLFRVLKRRIRVALQARLLGTVNSKKIWSVRGPIALRDALNAAGCTAVPYSQAMSLPPAKLAWVKARSTCVGEATRAGKTTRVWPCGANGVTEVRIDGLAPRVLYGSNVYTIAGVEP